MNDKPPLYAGFIGTWVLIPESCQYEQGPPPRSGTYRIEASDDDQLDFFMDWIDHEGSARSASFGGKADGSRVPFPGGELADAFSIEPVSPRELNSRAFYRGVERMVAQRQLDEHGVAMRVTQLVRLPGGESLANVSIYRKKPLPS
ncbi:MAG: hypothetical protein KC503_31550 [Myxococcales bacterium]|nr:hypothetical protein [Myxococcales bacterium]